MLKADRKLLCLPANNFGQRMADTVGQIIDRSQMPDEALDSASWHIAITEQRFRIVPQQLIQVRKFWLFEEFVLRPWGNADAPTREEVRSGLYTHPIYNDPDVVAWLATLGKTRYRSLPGGSGPAPGTRPSPSPGTGDGRDPGQLRPAPGTGEGA